MSPICPPFPGGRLFTATPHNGQQREYVLMQLHLYATLETGRNRKSPSLSHFGHEKIILHWTTCSWSWQASVIPFSANAVSIHFFEVEMKRVLAKVHKFTLGVDAYCGIQSTLHDINANLVKHIPQKLRILRWWRSSLTYIVARNQLHHLDHKMATRDEMASLVHETWIHHSNDSHTIQNPNLVSCLEGEIIRRIGRLRVDRDERFQATDDLENVPWWSL